MLSLGVLQTVYSGDKAEYFSDSVFSIIKESQLFFEYVIVVDGAVGSDLREILEQLRDLEKVSILELTVNVGLARALNYGLAKMKSDIVIRMDSDDIAMRDRLRISYDEYIASGEDVLGFGVSRFCSKSDLQKPITSGSSKSILFGFLFSSPLNHPTVVFKREVVLQVGGYPDVYRREDSALWLQLKASGYNIAVSKTPTLYFRQCENDIGRRIGWKYSISELILFKYKVRAFPSLILILIPLTLALFLLRNIPKKLFNVIYQLAKS